MAWIIFIGMLPSTFSHLSDGTRFDYRTALSQINATGPSIEVLAWPIAIQRAYDPALKSRDLPTERRSAGFGAQTLSGSLGHRISEALRQSW